MKERPEICKFCKYYEELPFTDEYLCTCEESDYADCPCESKDTCVEWEEREE